jgi:hypothetical protein
MNQGFIPRWKKVSLPNKLSVLCTAIIAIATVFYVIASFWQLDRKSKTLEEMRTNRDGSTGQANQVIENLPRPKNSWVTWAREHRRTVANPLPERVPSDC